MQSPCDQFCRSYARIKAFYHITPMLGQGTGSTNEFGSSKNVEPISLCRINPLPGSGLYIFVVVLMYATWSINLIIIIPQ